MPTQLAGFILRAKDRNVNAKFYEDLGLTNHAHQHGGPVHHEIGPVARDFVGEIYAASQNFSQDALMLYVDSIPDALLVAKKYGIAPTTKIRETAVIDFIYITDPDARPLMLIQKK